MEIKRMFAINGVNMAFVPNRRFKREYNRLFKQDPLAANTFLLLCELADERGQVVSLIEAEVWDLRTYSFYLQIRSLMKRSILWFFNHGFLNLRATQKLYNFFRLRAG